MRLSYMPTAAATKPRGASHTVGSTIASILFRPTTRSAIRMQDAAGTDARGPAAAATFDQPSADPGVDAHVRCNPRWTLYASRTR